MTSYRDQLEGTPRFFRIRRTKRIVMLLLLLLAILLSGYAMASQGVGLKPLYLPADGVITIAVAFALIATLANFMFRTQERRYAKRDSQRFLITKGSMSRAMTVLLAAAIIGTVLFLPPAGSALAGAMAETRSDEVGPAESRSFGFTNRDVFAFTHVTVIRVEVLGQTADVLLLPDVGAAQSQYVSPGNAFETVDRSNRLVHYNLTVSNPGASGRVVFTVEIRHAVSQDFTTTIPAILLGLAVSNGVWIAYIRPLRKKYEASSIYSLDYVQEVKTGERTFSEYAGGPKARPASPRPATPPAVVYTPQPAVIVPALARPPIPPPMPEPPAPPSVEEPPPPQPDASVVIADGSQLFTEGRFEEALAKFDEALEIEPSNMTALLAGAAALLRLGRRDESLIQYETVLKQDPHHPKALAGRAQAFEGQGRWREAASAWATYLQGSPGDLDARLRRAEALEASGERGAAVRTLEEALFLAPSDEHVRSRLQQLTVNVPMLLSKALIASASGNYGEAIADLDQILSVEPDNVNALVGKGIAFRRAGRFDEARAVLDRAIERQPGNVPALRAKGQVLEEKGAFDDALDVYDELLEASPNDPEVWALQGRVLERLGEGEEALASYHEALKIDPGNPEWKARATALEAARKGHEAFLEELFTIKGVGASRARALLAAGYDSPDAVRKATEDELANLRGMNRKVAGDILRHFREKAPTPESASPT